MKLEGTIALVTGANRGLGKALVAGLVEAGAAKVYAAARDANSLSAEGPRVVPLAFDTTKPEQIAAAAKRASDVTLLINNAGVLTSYNVLASYSVTQALRPELRAKRIALLAVLPGPIDTDMVKALPMLKTSPADTARGVLAGIAHDDEEIFPDPMAQQMAALWNKSHKELERAFAGF